MSFKTQNLKFLLIAFFAILIRFSLVHLGYNQDLETIHKIGSLSVGTNFYEAAPYIANWGPIPYWFFQLFCRLPGGAELNFFHYYTTAFCTLADLVTAGVLFELWGLIAASLFLFSPAAIIIAGYHCNAEPLLVAAASLALLAYQRNQKQNPTCVSPWFYFWIGVSLSIKHAFVLLPLWFVMRPNTLKERFKALLITYGTWVLFASPYLFPHPSFFIKNVLLYSSWSGNAIIPMEIKTLLRFLKIPFTEMALKPLWMPLFLSMMLGFGYFIRKLEFKKWFMFYPVALVAMSSAVALQYFATPCFALATEINSFVVAYHLFSGFHLSGHIEEIHLYKIGSWFNTQYNSEGKFWYNLNWLPLQAMLWGTLIQWIKTWQNNLKKI